MKPQAHSTRLRLLPCLSYLACPLAFNLSSFAMPIGGYTVVPYVVHALREFRPASVLDLGAGSGFFGAVVRQWLDYGVQPWNTKLIGVEAHAGYTNPLWDLYQFMMVGSIEQFLASNQDLFECIMLGDVIEHFDKPVGLAVLESCTKILQPRGRMYVATPSVFVPQEAVHGNELERHRSLWTAEDLQQLGFEILLDGKPDQFYSEMLLAEWTKPG